MGLGQHGDAWQADARWWGYSCLKCSSMK